MDKWNVNIGGIFANINKMTIQKCHAIKRIAFIMFSCSNAQFEISSDNSRETRSDLVVMRIIESLKKDDNNEVIEIKQRIILFFLIRVILVKVRNLEKFT